MPLLLLQMRNNDKRIKESRIREKLVKRTGERWKHNWTERDRGGRQTGWGRGPSGQRRH